ncbi:MAG: cytochrome C [Rubrivivax sp.]|nr:cytochrome C [Rubrivivax sp.]
MRLLAAAPVSAPVLAVAFALLHAQAVAQAPSAPGPLPAPPAATVPLPAPTRGKLLYDIHCIACHNSQMHWRDARVVRDWPSLVTQVRLWQERGKLQWSDDDIAAVARHLNDTIYRLPPPTVPRG